MFQYSSNSNKLMETETISKNEASLKSHTSKENFLGKITFGVFALIFCSLSLFVMHSCVNSEGNSSATKIENPSALVGTWIRDNGQIKIPGERLELLDDGKSISAGYGFNWKADNSRIHFTGHLGIAWSFNYNVTGTTLTLTDSDGTRATYIKRQK